MEQIDNSVDTVLLDMVTYLDEKCLTTEQVDILIRALVVMNEIVKVKNSKE